jgi:hypothetical protein
MQFKILGPVKDPVTMVAGSGIRDLVRLRKVYGPGRWRKRKGFAMVELPGGFVCEAEIHWYEATGVGRFEHKIKRLLEPRSP